MVEREFVNHEHALLECLNLLMVSLSRLLVKLDACNVFARLLHLFLPS
jgi:hypothetical protein